MMVIFNHNLDVSILHNVINKGHFNVNNLPYIVDFAERNSRIRSHKMLVTVLLILEAVRTDQFVSDQLFRNEGRRFQDVRLVSHISSKISQSLIGKNVQFKITLFFKTLSTYQH